MKKKHLLIALFVLIGLTFTSCDPECPDNIKIVFSGFLYTDAESKTPICDALIDPLVYVWINSDYTGQTYSSMWDKPLSAVPNAYSESLQMRGIFVTDSQGYWQKKISAHPTKVIFRVRYMGTDSLIHVFHTKEYVYENELSWQKIKIYADEYEQ